MGRLGKIVYVVYQSSFWSKWETIGIKLHLVDEDDNFAWRIWQKVIQLRLCAGLRHHQFLLRRVFLWTITTLTTYCLCWGGGGGWGSRNCTTCFDLLRLISYVLPLYPTEGKGVSVILWRIFYVNVYLHFCRKVEDIYESLA